MSNKHEDRARKLHTRLHESMHLYGKLKAFYSEVDRQSVTVGPDGEISVFFSYTDGSKTTIDFEPGKNAYDMAREAKRAAMNHCSEIREARRVAALADNVPAEPLTDEDVKAALAKPSIRDEARAYALRRAAEENLSLTERADADRAALKKQIAEALLRHRPAERSVEEVDGRRGVHVKCLGCDFGIFDPYREDQAAVSAFLDKARTADFPADGLDLAFADHQAEVILGLS